MLFMVIEYFKNDDPKPVGERFRQSGRMLPEGVIYLASWIDAPNSRCFQIMGSAGSGVAKPVDRRLERCSGV
jgi:hypothetical protein